MRPTNESTLRARARKLGYCIHKSRLRSINEDNLGKYALVKEDSRKVVLGERFDASLEENRGISELRSSRGWSLVMARPDDD